MLPRGNVRDLLGGMGGINWFVVGLKKMVLLTGWEFWFGFWEVLGLDILPFDI